LEYFGFLQSICTLVLYCTTSLLVLFSSGFVFQKTGGNSI